MNLSTLNENQKKAVTTTEGPLLLVAGAGSGKTRVLTMRIAYLIEEKGVNPWNILALTFTNKAAAEMKQRIRDQVGERADDIWSGTFHSVSSKILRRHAELLGYSSNFLIYDGYDQKSLIKSIIKSLGYIEKEIGLNLVFSRISKAKNAFVGPDEYYDKSNMTPEDLAVSKIYGKYIELLKTNNAMDFDDLILKVIELLERNEDIRKKYADKFRYIHVDEYQDTNVSQYRLIKLLADSNNICVVGDEDQSIYSWRGADIRNIKEFTKDFKNATLIKLEQNYRSTANILNLANSIIVNNMDRIDKKLWTSSEEGARASYYLASSEEDEALFVGKKIDEMCRDGRNYSDFAILYRSNAQSSDFEKVLTRGRIPYKIVGGLKFYERKEIKDLHSYLRLVMNPSDAVSAARIINEPKRGIGSVSVDKILRFADAEGLGFMSALAAVVENRMFGGEQLKSMKYFCDMIMGLHERLDDLKPSEILDEILDKTGYLLSLINEGTQEAKARLENIEELISQVMNMEAKDPDVRLAQYLEEVSLLSDQDEIDEESDNKVLLMTLHTAKGLEFDVVFMVGMEENIFPSYYALAEGSLEEERRLCYVGITRAKKQLFLSNAEMRYRFGKHQVNRPSVFLEEMPEELLDKINEPNVEYTRNEEAVSRAKPIVRQTGIKSDDIEDYSVGMKVKHRMFGTGVIIKITPRDKDRESLVAFDKRGLKRIMLASGELDIIG